MKAGNDSRPWHLDYSSEALPVMQFQSFTSYAGQTTGTGTLELRAILLVDDDKQLASALQWILADENFLVDVANNGEEALLKVEALEYDAIVCDLMMPRLRGDEFFLK